MPVFARDLIHREHVLDLCDSLAANALLLIRASGIRIGESDNLSLDCLRQVTPDR